MVQSMLFVLLCCALYLAHAKCQVGMGPPVSIVSTKHLDRLVKDSAKLVIHCFTTGKDDHSGSGSDNGGGGGFARVAQAFDELSSTLDASSSGVKSYRVDVASRPDVAASLPGAEGGEAGDGVSAARWLFFNGGKMVRACMYVPTSSSNCFLFGTR